MIEYQWERFEEDDCYWDALFVRINGGKWMLAKETFNTEDKELIEEIVKSYDTGNW
jgi:hypothetical protein